MATINRKPIFDAAKRLGAKFRSRADEQTMDRAIDASLASIGMVSPAPAPLAPHASPPTIANHGPGQRRIDHRGKALIHGFEQCRLEAYPDPGSRNGEPWTIGWGATGSGIHRGVVWTQAQADARFAEDVAKFEKAVSSAIGSAPTTQNQFNAMVSLCYNIGPTQFARSSVLRHHKAGRYVDAARSFVMWNKNDGKVMRGLTRRRLAEADLYDDV